MATDALYFEAAKIVKAVKQSRGTVKSLCYGSKYTNKKALFALVSEALKNFQILECVLEASEILKVEKKLDQWLAISLLQDFLYKERLGCQPKLAESILKHKARLRGEFVKAKLKASKEDCPPTIQLDGPKYARINTLKASLATCMQSLSELGYAPNLDAHIANLLWFPPATSFQACPLYKEGKLILQDKASCIPAYILNPPKGSHVLDACAAPGNKTTHLSAILDNTGKIFAFERDPKRFKTLSEMTAKAGCKNVVAECRDFLSIDPNAFSTVQYALVDPSCSGSGILKDHEANRGPIDPNRLRSLANFQCMAVRHALKCIVIKFYCVESNDLCLVPKLRKLVYSTCSIQEEENEQVVEQVLAAEPDFILEPNPLPEWPRRGLTKYSFADNVIRADPLLDGTHGFFVASFIRKE